MNFRDLATLLEKAAFALRKSADALDEVPTDEAGRKPLKEMEGYLCLSVRALNILDGMRVLLAGDLTRLTADDLLGENNMGKVTLKEIRRFLARNSMALKGESIWNDEV